MKNWAKSESRGMGQKNPLCKLAFLMPSQIHNKMKKKKSQKEPNGKIDQLIQLVADMMKIALSVKRLMSTPERKTKSAGKIKEKKPTTKT